LSKYVVGVIDYDSGNIDSVGNIFKELNFRVKVIRNSDEVPSVDALVIPGVGAFNQAIDALNKDGCTEEILRFATSGKPLLGICLGMQLLVERSSEFGHAKGLSLIPGDVEPIPQARWHIGWNSVRFSNTSFGLESLSDSDFYFNHSFEVKTEEKYQIAHVDHHSKIVAGIARDNVVGFQFHPEKSQRAGVLLIEKIVKRIFNA